MRHGNEMDLLRKVHDSMKPAATTKKGGAGARKGKNVSFKDGTKQPK